VSESQAGCAVSIVVPAYNEEGNLRPLMAEIAPVMDALGAPYEVILVDDGSTDGTRAEIRDLVRERPNVRGLLFERNAGQSAAFGAGFRAARGRVVVTMDADMQNNPADIPRLLEAMEREGADAACGIRAKRRDNLVRRVSSRIGNTVRNWFTGDGLKDTGCSLKAIRREMAARMPVFNGLHRFLGAMLRCQNARVVQIAVDHRPRASGQPKYGRFAVWSRLMRGIRDLFGVSWLMRRWVNYRIEEEIG